ncbi:MAG: LLM class flavin-dependent oxidoreductase [Chloroflexi bacterium]|nr:LLM class flavin-dependent oxidoreductase [Chloroflexota bacterium]
MADKSKRYWGFVTADVPAAAVAAQAKMQEDAGLEGLMAAQLYSTPFIPLAAAATVTSRVRLLSGIALAFTRSPYETAVAAMDMDRISGGRFILGLGCSVRALSEEIYGMPYGKPLAHMREVVEIIRMVISKAHTGELQRYEGVYHQHDFNLLEWLSPPPPLRTDLPIWIAALRGPLVSLAAEIADGVMGHPIWTVPWATTKIPEALERGLKRGGKQRSDIEFQAGLYVALSNDRAEAINDARPTVAFYAGAAQYEEYFAAHGFREEARRLQEGVKHGGHAGAAHLVPDEMAETFVVCGTPDEVRKKIEPVWDVADSLVLVPPAYALPPEKLMAYVGAIASTFYS